MQVIKYIVYKQILQSNRHCGIPNSLNYTIRIFLLAFPNIESFYCFHFVRFIVILTD